MPAHISQGCKNLISSMLVREPTKRATLQEIAKDGWLMQGAEQPNQPELTPLVSREQVSDDDHALIIQKMVSGNIATKEEILE
jgi:SNF-related kinase